MTGNRTRGRRVAVHTLPLRHGSSTGWMDGDRIIDR